MKSILLIFSLTFLTASVFSQKKLTKGVQKYSPKKITTEVLDKRFYLIHKEDINKLFLEKGIKIIRRLSDDFLIIGIKNIKTFSVLKKSKNLYKINNYWKFSPQINTKRQSTKRFLTINIKTLNNDSFLEEIKQYNIDFKLLYNHNHKDILTLKIPAKQLSIIASIYNCIFIDIHHIPKTEATINTNLDLSVNTIPYLHNIYPNVHGKDINVSVKELLFDIEDIDLKNRIQLYGVEAKETSAHATEMATIIGGAGNTSQGAKGVAFESTLTSSDFSTLLPDADETYENNNVYIQNHSYGTEIENFYGIQANAFDEHTINIPKSLHVFSSGNIGNTTSEEGRYKGVSGYANISGNFKMAKNALVIGGIDEQLEINARSSKGPTYDGRIKPELVAHGPGGTSDAAAIVSGVATLLQQKHKIDHNSIPPSSLIKALLIAGADDIGPKGIDFKSGYGNVNAIQSISMLDANTFINDDLSSGKTKKYIIPINSAVKVLRIALVWNDPPANIGDTKALVNDLDMELKLNTSLWLPWVLDASPSLVSIEKEAITGKDHVNNVEYITVNNPELGNYTLDITANTLVSTQSFSIAYYVEPANTFTWNYPTKKDALPSNTEKNIRWKNNFNEPINQIEYSVNNEPWKILSNSSNITTSFLLWNVPNRGGITKLRALVNGVYYVSEDFVISDIIIPSIEFNCEEEIQFSWDRVSNATGYNFQLLGNQYMTTHKTTTETSINVSKKNLQNPYVSITPIFGNKKGVKGQTINYTLQGVNCYYKSFYAFLDEKNVVKNTLNLSTLTNVSSVVFERITNGEVEVVKTIINPLSTQLIADDSNIQGGSNVYRVRILLNNGVEVITESVEIEFPFSNSLEIYPNPVTASNGIFIYSKGNNVNVQIVDTSGRVILINTLTKIKQKIPIPNIKSGIYFVRLVKENSQLAVKKIIIKE